MALWRKIQKNKECKVFDEFSHANEINVTDYQWDDSVGSALSMETVERDSLFKSRASYMKINGSRVDFPPLKESSDSNFTGVFEVGYEHLEASSLPSTGEGKSLYVPFKCNKQPGVWELISPEEDSLIEKGNSALTHLGSSVSQVFGKLSTLAPSQAVFSDTPLSDFDLSMPLMLEVIVNYGGKSKAIDVLNCTGSAEFITCTLGKVEVQSYIWGSSSLAVSSSWKDPLPGICVKSRGIAVVIKNRTTSTSQVDYAILIIDSTVGGFEAGIPTEGQTCKRTSVAFILGVNEIICCYDKMDVTSSNYSMVSGIEKVQGELGKMINYLGGQLPNGILYAHFAKTIAPKQRYQFEETRSIKIIQDVDEYIMWLQYHNFGVVTYDLLDTGHGINGLNALDVQLALDNFLIVFICLDLFPLEVSAHVKESLAKVTKEHNEYVDCIVLVSMLWFSAILVGSGCAFVLEVFGYVHCKSWWQIANLEGAYSVAVQGSLFCKEVDEGNGISWNRNNIDKESRMYLAKVAATSISFYNIMVSGVALETRVEGREIEQHDNIEFLVRSLVDLLLFYHESMVEHMIFVIVRVYFLTVEVDEIGHESAMKPSLKKDDNSGAISLIYSLEQKTNESMLELDGDPISGDLFLPFVLCDFEVALCFTGVPYFEDYFQPYSVVDMSRAASKKKYRQGWAQAFVVSLSVWLCCEIIYQTLQWWHSKPPTVGVATLSKHVNNDNNVLVELIEEVFTLLKGSGFAGGLHTRAVLNAFVGVLIGRQAKELTNSAIQRFATIPQPQEYALVGSDAMLSSFFLVQVLKPHPREREGSIVKYLAACYSTQSGSVLSSFLEQNSRARDHACEVWYTIIKYIFKHFARHILVDEFSGCNIAMLYKNILDPFSHSWCASKAIPT